MKKKVAVFVNGWSDEFVKAIMQGMQRCAGEHNTDLFVFMNYTSWSDSEALILGEKNVFHLPDLKTFDGAVLATNTICLEEERELLRKKALESNIPVVTLECELQGIPFIGSDNSTGMYELVEHLLTAHSVKEILLVGGTADHAESEERIRAARRAAKDYGIEIDEDHLVFGQWYHVEAGKLVKKWIKEHKRLPGAVVCVNDDMALGVSNSLEEEGYIIPDDVIVTGYDDLLAGRECSPALTSVAKAKEEIGYRALEVVLDRIAGNKTEEKYLFPSKMRVGESCGCSLENIHNESRRKIGRKAYQRKMNSVMVDGYFREVMKVSRKAQTVDELRGFLCSQFTKARIFTSPECCLAVNQDYLRLDDDCYPATKVGFGDKMDIICAICNGKISEVKEIPTMQLIPEYDPESETTHMYVFVALFSESHSVGYATIADDLTVFDDFKFYTWTRHMNQNLDQVRQNINLQLLHGKLKKLSLTDALTGLYNRMGCEELVVPFIKARQAEGKKSFLMISDINKMKSINDEYGHLQGDVALKTVSEALRTVFAEETIRVRFGGDEFLIVGECKDKEEVQRLDEQMESRLKELCKSMQLVFPLGVSNGFTVIDPGEEVSLDVFIKRADEEMYVDKKSNV